jgi:drug/metabolite transporter (DMT)-like permease
LSSRSSGLFWGFLGVLAFSFTVPLTRVAVEGMSPLFIGSGRAVLAAILATFVLVVTRQKLPNARQFRHLVVVGAGVVVGFPYFTSYALETVPAAHAAVVIGLLPIATAVVAVIRTSERVHGRFWVFAILGAISAISFASVAAGEFGHFEWADLLLVGAVITSAIGYSEGAVVSRELGSWQTISWTLVIWSPVMIIMTIVSVATQPITATPWQWAAFVYLGAVSMYLSFFGWYRGLAIGPITTVSQVQLVQPVLSIVWAALILGEVITLDVAVGGAVVIACSALAVRTRLKS